MFVFVVLSRRRQTRCAVVTGVHTCALPICRRLSWEPARIETKPPSDFLSSALVAGSHGSRRGLKLGLAFAGERQAQVAGSHGSRRGLKLVLAGLVDALERVAGSHGSRSGLQLRPRQAGDPERSGERRGRKSG